MQLGQCLMERDQDALRRDYGSQAGETGSSENRCEDRVCVNEYLLGQCLREKTGWGSWKWLKGLSDHTRHATDFRAASGP